MKKLIYLLLPVFLIACKDEKENIAPAPAPNPAPATAFQQLTNYPEGVRGVAISDDGQTIYYTVFGAMSSIGNFPVDLYSMNSDGSNQKKILTYPQASGFHFIISKNNQQLAFSARKNTNIGAGSEAELVVGNINGTGLRTILRDRNIYPVQAFVDNDQSLLYGSYFSTGPCGCNNIWKVRTDSTSNKLLTGPTDNAAATAVSPDRSLILADFNSAAYIMDTNGQNKVQLGSNFRPWDITPDNATVLMHKLMPWGNKPNTVQVFVSNANGTAHKQLTTMEGTNLPHSFFPGGQEVLFQFYPGSSGKGDSELYAVNIDGTGQKRLTNNTVDEVPIGYLEKKKKILLSIAQNRVGNLYVLDLK